MLSIWQIVLKYSTKWQSHDFYARGASVKTYHIHIYFDILEIIKTINADEVERHRYNIFLTN